MVNRITNECNVWGTGPWRWNHSYSFGYFFCLTMGWISTA